MVGINLIEIIRNYRDARLCENLTSLLDKILEILDVKDKGKPINKKTINIRNYTLEIEMERLPISSDLYTKATCQGKELRFGNTGGRILEARAIIKYRNEPIASVTCYGDRFTGYDCKYNCSYGICECNDSCTINIYDRSKLKKFIKLANKWVEELDLTSLCNRFVSILNKIFISRRQSTQEEYYMQVGDFTIKIRYAEPPYKSAEVYYKDRPVAKIVECPGEYFSATGDSTYKCFNKICYRENITGDRECLTVFDPIELYKFLKLAERWLEEQKQ